MLFWIVVRRCSDRIVENRNRRELQSQLEIDKEYQIQINQEHQESQLCVSCMENVRSVKLNCGHTILCHSCAHKIKHMLKVCPVCRTEIINIKEEMFSEKDYSPSTSSDSR